MLQKEAIKTRNRVSQMITHGVNKQQFNTEIKTFVGRIHMLHPVEKVKTSVATTLGEVRQPGYNVDIMINVDNN